MIGLLESAIALDPSRPEGYYIVASLYETLNLWDKASDAYRAAMIIDPSDIRARYQLVNLSAFSRNADEYFRQVNDLLPRESLSDPISLVGNGEALDVSKLSRPVVMQFVETSCGPCVGLALPEINKRKIDGTLPFDFYAIFLSDKGEKVTNFVHGKDANGSDWRIRFGLATDQIRKQLGAHDDLVFSYYIFDRNGVPRAFLVAHSTSSVETLSWLVNEVSARW